MSVNLGTAYAELKVKTEGFSQGLKQAESDLSSFQSSANAISRGFSNVGASLTKTGKTLTTVVTVPLVGLTTAAVKTAASFDSSMSKVQALSGATGEEFDALRNKAIEMGAKTSFSATESADALGYMALAGWETQQMIDALPGVLDLAAASGMGLAEASDMVTDYLTAFGLEAADATKMSNEMAYAQSHSNTSTQQLGDAFGNCAAQMNTAGQTMETTTAFLEAMANQGTKGSEAGTALAAVMRDITNKMEDGAIAIGDTNVQVMDQNGNFRSLIDIMADVEKATEGMGTAEKSAALMQTFTAHSIKAVSESLTEGTDNIRGYEEALHDVDGVASDMAKTMLNNLNGQLKLLMSALETLAIQIGDILMPHISKIVEKIQGLVETFTALDDSQKEQILKWAAIVAAIGPALIIFGKLATSIGAIIKFAGTLGTLFSAIKLGATHVVEAFKLAKAGFMGFATETSKLGAMLGSLSASVAAIIALVVALVAAFVTLWNTNEDFRNSVIKIWSSVVDKFKEAGRKIVDAINSLGFNFKDVISVLKAAWMGFCNMLAPYFLGIVKYLSTVISGIVDIVTGVIQVITGIIKGFKDGDWTLFLEGLKTLFFGFLELITAPFRGIWEAFTGYLKAFGTSWERIWTNIVQFFVNIIQNVVKIFTVKIPEEFRKFTGITLPNFIDTCKRFFEKLPYNLGFAIGYAMQKIIDWGLNLISWAKQKIPEFVSAVVKFISELPGKIWNWLQQVLSKVTTWGQNMISKGKESAKNFVDNVISFISGLPGSIWNWLQQAISKVITWGSDMIDKAKSIAKDFVDNFVGFIKDLPGKIWGVISGIPNKILGITHDMYEAGKSLFTNLWNGFKAVWNSITGWFDDVLKAVKDFLKGIKDGMTEANKASAKASSGSHADGLAYVPYDGYRATLHEGERVLTKNQAENYNSGRSSSSYTFNYYSPKAIDPYEANRLFRESVRKMEEGFA